MPNHLLQVNTSGSFSFHSITDEVQRFINAENIIEGILIASGKHTTTALIVNEMEERLLIDIKSWLFSLAPSDRKYKHNDLHLRQNIPADEPRNAHAHLQALLLGNSISLPIVNGILDLGKYQDIILVELDGPKQRDVTLNLINSIREEP